MFKVILSRFLISDDLANKIMLLGVIALIMRCTAHRKFASSDSNLVLA